MKALVTGGSGFIGSTLTDALIDKGWEVHTLDNLSATTHESFYFNNKATNHNFHLCDEANLIKLFKENSFDYVFHLAAESRIQPTLKNPPSACNVNAVGTCQILQRALDTGVKRVMYSSTSSVYGLKNAPPLREDMPVDCLNPYSVSKYSGELLCKMYLDLFGLETITFRYFNVYGPREPVRGLYAPVIGRFLNQYNNGECMTVVGDGLKTRDYTHVNDVVGINILAAESDNPEAVGQVFNVGQGKSYSVMDLTEIIGGPHVLIPDRPGEAQDTLADISKARDLLGWDPKENLVEYMKKQLT